MLQSPLAVEITTNGSVEPNQLSSTSAAIPQALPRKKHLCHVCSTLIAADQKFQKNDIVFHQECYDQIQNDSAYESNKTVEESNVSEDLEPKIIEKSNKDPTPELHSENSISSSNSQKLITNTNQSIEQPIEQPTDQPPIESRDKIEVDRSTSESQIIESLDQFSISKEETKTIKDQKEDYYPEELNPFGSDDDDDEADDDPSDTKKIQQSNTNKFAIRIPKDEEYPDELNPFADDDDDEDVSPASTNCNHFKLNTTKASTIDDYDESLNPFANDEDDEEDVTEYASNSLSKPPPTAPRSSLQRIHQSNSALDYSPYSSIRSSSFDTRNTSTPNRSMTPNHGGKLPSNKKRAAPKPPTSISPSTSLTSSINLGDRLNACSQSNPVTPEISRKLSSLRSTSKLSCHSEFGPSSVTTSSAHTLHAAERSYDSLFDDHRPSSFKRSFESTCKQRLSLRDTSGSGTIPRCVKKKKAPPPPISVRRIVSCSAVEIIAEINEIGDKLSDNESSIKQIEETLQSHQNQTHDLTKGKIKKLIFEYLNLISVKCALAKRQEELMYMRRENKLEEEHSDLEFKVRLLMNKSSTERTESDEQQEETLMQQLLDVIEERNEIVENMMKIDKRNEFDVLVERIKQLASSQLVDPILNDFMQNCFSEKVLRNDQSVKSKTMTLDSNLKQKVAKERNKKVFTLKKITKLSKKVI